MRMMTSTMGLLRAATTIACALLIACGGLAVEGTEQQRSGGKQDGVTPEAAEEAPSQVSVEFLPDPLGPMRANNCLNRAKEADDDAPFADSCAEGYAVVRGTATCAEGTTLVDGTISISRPIVGEVAQADLALLDESTGELAASADDDAPVFYVSNAALATNVGADGTYTMLVPLPADGGALSTGIIAMIERQRCLTPLRLVCSFEPLSQQLFHLEIPEGTRSGDWIAGVDLPIACSPISGS